MTKLTPEQVAEIEAAEAVAAQIVDECRAAAQDLKHLNKCQPGNGYGLKATVLYTQALEWAATMRALLADRASLVAEREDALNQAVWGGIEMVLCGLSDDLAGEIRSEITDDEIESVVARLTPPTGN